VYEQEETNGSERTRPTDMQLVIPIEDTSSGNNSSNHCIEKQHKLETGNRSAFASLERNPKNDGAILSDDLRDQFETMKCVWRQARRGSEDFDSSSSNDSSITKKRRGNVRAELKRKEREMAVETAIKVEREIALWEEGIADLEALLAVEDDRESDEETTADGDEQEGVEESGPAGIIEIAFVRHNYAHPRVPPVQIECPFVHQVPSVDESDEVENHFTSSSM